MTKPSKPKGFLFDVRVIEIADHRGEFLGKLLAGAGAPHLSEHSNEILSDLGLNAEAVGKLRSTNVV